MTMTESEARSKIKYRLDIARKIAGDNKSFEDLEIAVKVLKEIRQHREMQKKLKMWIENYKNPEFKDVVVTRDNLIDILEEFRLECETDGCN